MLPMYVLFVKSCHVPYCVESWRLTLEWQPKKTTHVDWHLLLLITRQCNHRTYLFILHSCLFHLSCIFNSDLVSNQITQFSRNVSRIESNQYINTNEIETTGKKYEKNKYIFKTSGKVVIILLNKSVAIRTISIPCVRHKEKMKEKKQPYTHACMYYMIVSIFAIASQHTIE